MATFLRLKINVVSNKIDLYKCKSNNYNHE